jgi:hypothetical protein
MSYDAKVKVIAFIIKTEAELDVTASSWKHCVLYLYLTGTLTEIQFREQFDFNE